MNTIGSKITYPNVLKKLCTLKPRCTKDIHITTTKVDPCHTILPNNTNPHSFTYSWRIVQQNNSVPHQTPASLLFLKPRTKDQQTFYTCTSTLWEINIIYADIILEIEKNKYWAKKIIFRWLVYHKVLLSKLCIFLLNHQKKVIILNLKSCFEMESMWLMLFLS